MFQEAGIFAWFIVVTFAAGLFALVVKGREDPWRTATPFVLVMIALGNIGFGMGQRLVRDAVERVPDVSKQVKFLNIGTGEAVANVIISGCAALLLVVVAAAISRLGRNRE